MKLEKRREAAGEMIAFIHSEKVAFSGAQLSMINGWVELLQWVTKQANQVEKELNPEGKGKKKLSEIKS